jgi:hypothetical protein
MLDVSYIAIREDALQRVREWLASLSTRREELSRLAKAQTVSHELAHLIHGENGPVLVYVLEASDLNAARAAIREGALPLATEWQQLIAECSSGHPSHEVLFEHVVTSSPAA